MEPMQIKLAGLWTALMLTYLLGDVLRIFAGDFVAGKMGGQEVSQVMWFLAALMMLVPIAMILVSLLLGPPVSRWISIIAAILLLVINAAGIRSYPGFYDRFLIGVGLLINGFTVWLAWNWKT
jgi:hypothetical protein